MKNTSDTVEFFVSPDGDDANPGTKTHPFATLERTRRVVRDTKGETPVTVWLRGGTYYLSETLVFGPEDSGTEKAPVLYKAYEDEKPIISGGTRIEAEWQPYKDGIYMCSLMGTVPGENGFTQLFVNGKRQIRARFPNGDPNSPDFDNFDFLQGADLTKEFRLQKKSHRSGTDGVLPHRELYFDPGTFTQKTWKRPEEAVLHIFPLVNWSTLQFRLRGIDRRRNAIFLGEGGWQQHMKYATRPGTTLGKGSRFYIENVFEELDDEREWYFDGRQQVLYYKPSELVDLHSAIVVVPRLRSLIEFRGTRENPVHDIHFEGVRVTHTTTTFFDAYDIPSFGDWAIVRSGAILFEGAENCAVDNCFFDGVGGNALFINNYNKGIRVENSIVSESGESAICIVGKSRMTRTLSYRCPFCENEHPWGFQPYNEEYPRECVVRNNRIYNVGLYGKQTAGVFISMGAKHIVSHNEIYNIPRAAICIHDGMYGGHTIEDNFLHHTCRETQEHGTFNGWGRDQWWCHNQSHGTASHPAGDVKKDARYTNILRGNLIIDRKGWGIDLDDGCSNYHIYNNLCIGVAIKLREGDFRLVENNVVINAASCGIQAGCENNSDRIVRNVIHNDVRFGDAFQHYTGRRDGACMTVTRPASEGSWVREMDYNCYFSGIGRFVGVVGKERFEGRLKPKREVSWKEWRENGLDENSIYADPMFQNPDQLDFSVQLESPALRLGFKNVPMGEWGLSDTFPSTWRDEEPGFPPLYAKDDTAMTIEDNRLFGMTEKG